MEEPQQHSGDQKIGDDDDERRVSSVRRRTGPGNRPRRPLFLRCLLIRNLPKGFVGWSDLTDKNTPIRVRRIVYCEESNGSIMVEFMSEAERNTILALDTQRKRRIHQRIQEQAPSEATSGSSTNKSKSYAFEIKVTVERCSSERFVRTILLGGLNTNPVRRAGTPRSDHPEQESAEFSPLLTGTFTDPTSPLASPSPSPSPPSRLVRRCIVIRKCSNPDNVEEDLEIPEAPPYERRIRSDDGSIRSADSVGPKLRPPSPMEIRSGNLCEVVVRGVALRSKSKMMPAMVVELESEESVERIMWAEEAKQRIEDAEPTTLAIPVELHAVKSERYARLCFGNTRVNPKHKERNSRNSNGNESHTYVVENEKEGGVEEESRGIMTDETTNATGGSDFQMTVETVEDDIGIEEQTEKQEIENLKKEIRDARAEMGRWKQRAMVQNSSSNNSGSLQNSDMADVSNDAENPQNSASSCRNQIESGLSKEPNHHREWMEEQRKNEVLEEKVRELLAENDRLKAADSTQPPLEEKKEMVDSSQEESKQQQQALLTENDTLKARVAEMKKMESEVEESRAHMKQMEVARNKLEDENSGLLRYVLELEGLRSGKAMADEERLKELEKKHSDLSTLYRFVQAQVDKSAKELRKAMEEKESIRTELEGFKLAWRGRMETQRRLEESKNKDGGRLCIDCETVKFYTILEECKNNGEEESGHSIYESEAAAISKAKIANNVSPGHDQTNEQAQELLMA